MCMLSGYKKTEKYCNLRKALYDLKQSSRTWFDRLKIIMRSMDYRQGNSNHTLFTNYDGEKISIFLIYIDDIVITGDNEEEITRLKNKLGKLRYFLGVEFATLKGGFVMSKEKTRLIKIN